MNLFQKLRIKSNKNRFETKRNLTEIKTDSNIFSYEQLKREHGQKMQQKKDKLELMSADLDICKQEYKGDFVRQEFDTTKKSNKQDLKSTFKISLSSYICMLISAFMSMLGLYFSGYFNLKALLDTQDMAQTLSAYTMLVVFVGLSYVNNFLINLAPNYLNKFLSLKDRKTICKAGGLLLGIGTGTSFSCYSNMLFLKNYLQWGGLILFVGCIFFDACQVILSYVRYDRTTQNYTEEYKEKFMKSTEPTTQKVEVLETEEPAEEPPKKIEKNDNFDMAQNTAVAVKMPLIGFSYPEQKEEIKEEIIEAPVEAKKEAGKAGRKPDKRTIEKISKAVSQLEDNKRITNKSINFTGSKDTLHRVCKDYLSDIVEVRETADGKTLLYRK